MRACVALTALLSLLASASGFVQPRWVAAPQGRCGRAAAASRRAASRRVASRTPLRASAELMDAISGASYLLADSKLVQAKEVYGPIFTMGVFLGGSGLASAVLLGLLISDDNIEELNEDFFGQQTAALEKQQEVEAGIQAAKVAPDDDYLD
eukprot:CAMPEP_0119496288 /NCGR_PEP_ID=MMETSP1344-20130328/19668_1 /TAXON_ID=236787 /ORGANISM="Florenciella parvula, Strain CCMP2471" /LENGTH=151 /DNA_ID=CAMNT_0007531963 /DNA_START=14 /DNA_END=469 /DNA_ORIENTATION=+